MDKSFTILQMKEIYELLEGGTGDFPDLAEYNGVYYNLPYCSAAQLNEICRAFGYTGELGGSRWTYVEALMQFAIDNNRCGELLSYFFSVERFKNLNELPSFDEIDKAHQIIVNAAIDRINSLIRLSRKELQLIGGQFYIVDVGKRPAIATPKVDIISIAYIHSLKERCLGAGSYDSVVTKSRTLMEETLLQVLEKRNVQITAKGDLIKLFDQTKNTLGMKPGTGSFDKRVHSLLQGLETIVQSVAEMRNKNSDAHGAGSKRINIREKEARLVMNSAITFCEYMLSFI